MFRHMLLYASVILCFARQKWHLHVLVFIAAPLIQRQKQRAVKVSTIEDIYDVSIK